MEIRQIEYCLSNEGQAVNEVVAALRELYPDANVMEWGCLGYCDQCFRKPFVFLNDQVLVEADTASALIERIKKTAAD